MLSVISGEKQSDSQSNTGLQNSIIYREEKRGFPAEELNVCMLAILIARAKENQQFKGVVPRLVVDDGLSILQYADDTILFMENKLKQAKNIKLLLCAFEQLSGLKINFHKSKLFCFGEAMVFKTEYEQIFGCGQGMFPFRYLGIPMHYKRLKNSDWKGVDERFQKG